MSLSKRRIKRGAALQDRPADMVTLNRSQMAAAIAAVPPDCDTVIEAINKEGKVLARYAFPHGETHLERLSHGEHVEKLSRSVMKTPANIWR